MYISLEIWSVWALSQREENASLLTHNYKFDIGRSTTLWPGQTSEPAVGSLTAQLADVSHFASVVTGSELSDQNDHR